MDPLQERLHLGIGLIANALLDRFHHEVVELLLRIQQDNRQNRQQRGSREGDRSRHGPEAAGLSTAKVAIIRPVIQQGCQDSGEHHPEPKRDKVRHHAQQARLERRTEENRIRGGMKTGGVQVIGLNSQVRRWRDVNRRRRRKLDPNLGCVAFGTEWAPALNFCTTLFAEMIHS